MATPRHIAEGRAGVGLSTHRDSSDPRVISRGCCRCAGIAKPAGPSYSWLCRLLPEPSRRTRDPRGVERAQEVPLGQEADDICRFQRSHGCTGRLPEVHGRVTLGAVMHEGECHPEPLVSLPLGMMNRHGLIAGATGTGKTKTLQLIAEQLSAAGVPVFLADIKGDLSGICDAGEASDRVTQRAKDTGFGWKGTPFPVEFLSLTGQRGAQLRATVSSFGPLLLAKVLDLNETQTSVLALVFKYCDDRSLPLLDLPGPARRAAVPDRGRRGRPRGLRRHVEGHRRRAAARDGGAGAAGRAGVLRRAGVRPGGPDADRARRPRAGEHPRAHRRAGQAGAVLDLHDVDAGAALPRAARGGRPREAEAGLLLRRGAPPLRRREQGVPRPGRAGGAADPLEGRRRLLHHPESRRTFRPTCSASSATACSTRCAPSRPTTRRRSRRRRAPSRRPSSTTSRRPSRRSASARRSSRCWARGACRRRRSPRA